MRHPRRPVPFVAPFRTAIFAAALSLGLLGCGDGTSPVSQRLELQANRAKWQRAALVSYTLVLQQSCFCAYTQPVRLYVVNDVIVRALPFSGDTAVSPTFFPTVDRLFAFIDDAITRRAAVLRVTYDPTLGFPIEIVYDGAVNVADDEVTYRLSDLHESAPPP
ncbi:MAG TPA: DUF6174 domain-containing protein [Gemmatimonadaceae bacterium]|nr:DUF6174 domain-containing protein [Gemmatimonadaceae bacterium]